MDGTVFRYAADGFTTGVVDGHEVRCLSARQQLEFREGYPWRDADRHDVQLLRAHRETGRSIAEPVDVVRDRTR